MSLTIEWRVSYDGADALIIVDNPENQVTEVARPDVHVLDAYLKVTGDLAQWRAGPAAWEPAGPPNDRAEEWGELIIQRAEDGQVLFVDPDLYWEGVRRWFRSRRSRQF